MRVAGALAALVVAAALASLQLASDSLLANAAMPGSVPRIVPPSYGVAAYASLDRIFPGGLFGASLAERDLDAGDLAGASSYASRLRAGSARDELLGRIALARRERALALSYFLAAPDVARLQDAAIAQSRADPLGAYRFEESVRDRLSQLRTHPDAVAEADYTMGTIALLCARNDEAQRGTWVRRALGDDVEAATLAPFSEKYLRATAGVELELGDRDAARRYDARVLAIDPGAAF